MSVADIKSERREERELRLLTGPGPEIHRAQSDEVALCSLQAASYLPFIYIYIQSLCLLLSVSLLIDLALCAGGPWAPVSW